MAGVELIDPTELYNLLNQGTTYPCLSDPNYLLLLDSRSKDDYAESHILTAKKAPKNDGCEYVAPYDAELECKQHVIVYDGNTRSLKEEGDARSCAKVMWDMGSRTSVKVLKGGYEDFSALYPFLRDQKILYMPKEVDLIRTFPAEVIPGSLFLGNWRQGNAAYIQKDIKVKGHVNCCVEEGSFYREAGPNLLHIPVEDHQESDLQSKFRTACHYIDSRRAAGEVVLVFSQLGISRSVTVVLAYLMHTNTSTLKDAWSHLVSCCPTIRPNRGFMQQLSQWEEELLGNKITDIADPKY